MNRWATFLIAAFIAAVLLALTGCENQTNRPYMLLTDEDGCKWLGRTTNADTELRPLLAGKDSKQVCK